MCRPSRCLRKDYTSDMLRPKDVLAGVSVFPARTPTLPPATHTNSYALGTREVLLVEPATPYEDEQRAWIDWARAMTDRNVIGILVTHHHDDHVGGLDVLARELDLPVWAHDATVERLAPALRARIARRLGEGDAIVLDGPSPSRWSVLHTPGHAPGHLCLHDAEAGALVVGDMVASIGTILVAPGDGDMIAYLASLERLAALDAKIALPAHGEAIDEPVTLFRKYVSHRLMREGKVLDAVVAAGSEGADIATLTARAYDDTPVHLWPFAQLSLRAHLEKLEREGRVAQAAQRFRVV